MKTLYTSCSLLTLLIALAVPVASAQSTGTITGTVTDARGNALPGAQVIVAGTSLGTVTGIDGRYALDGVPAGEHTVEVRFVGYQTGEATVSVEAGGRIRLDFALEEEVLRFDELIVTGTFDRRSAQEASVAITTLTPQVLEQTVPVSSADVLKNVPGVFVNSALGEIRNIVYSRGVSANTVDADRGYYYVSMQEDGLPVTTLTGGNYGPDYYLRHDLTVTRVEAVRGGSASITSANAPGGVFNYLSRTGAGTFGGAVSTRNGLQGGDNPFVRFDATLGGPLSEKVTFNVGGFYRYDEGARDAGYPMNQGGQLKGNLTYGLENGFLRFYAKYLHDTNGWFEFIPAVNFSDPTFAQGFDAASSVLFEPMAVPVYSTRRNETLTLDPSKLVNSREQMIQFQLVQFLDGWEIDNNARFSHKGRTWQSSGVIFMSHPADPLVYLIGGMAVDFGTYRFTDPDTGTLMAEVVRAPGSPFDPSTYTVTTNNLPNGGRFLNGLALDFRASVNEVMDQFQVAREVGPMRFVAGGFFAYADLVQTNSFGSLVTNTFVPRPQALTVTYTALDGTTYQVTEPHGFWNTTLSETRNDASQLTLAGFFNHSWELSDRFNLDYGFRLERVRNEGTNSIASLVRPPVGTAGGRDGSPLTLYDNATVTFEDFSYDATVTTFSFSGGLNYELTNRLAIYGRFSRGNKAPDLILYNDIDTQFEAETLEPITQKITQVEGGLKYRSPRMTLIATPFYSFLDDFAISTPFQNEDGTFYTPPTLFNAIETYGVEVEFDADLSHGFGLRAVTTLQNSTATRWKLNVANNPGPADDQVLDFSGGKAENAADVMFTLTPRFQRGRFSSFATIRYMGARPANVPRAFDLPAFTTVDLGVDVDVTPRVHLGASVSNLFDTAGIMSWTPPGLLIGRQTFTPEQVAANPDATFGVVPVQPRSFFVSLRYDF
ncbi:TonB-dependent receptor [Rhodocaloribacter litoris]|uniref:TonB-dependent receptor n=1 Tax=Rhodocaloribacter litoris TaxID=2558931 RepID=UPI0014221771|nr:TonB-dependent receptor [Rhodocaloribacter litoris]QXD15380.1 TonB-dependent receptor [Rhodocaloribacter litoris]